MVISAPVTEHSMNTNRTINQLIFPNVPKQETRLTSGTIFELKVSILRGYKNMLLSESQTTFWWNVSPLPLSSNNKQATEHNEAGSNQHCAAFTVVKS
jgi:hypothetical protein